jgi:hypothetical protein
MTMFRWVCAGRAQPGPERRRAFVERRHRGPATVDEEHPKILVNALADAEQLRLPPVVGPLSTSLSQALRSRPHRQAPDRRHRLSGGGALETLMPGIATSRRAVASKRPSSTHSALTVGLSITTAVRFAARPDGSRSAITREGLVHALE